MFTTVIVGAHGDRAGDTTALAAALGAGKLVLVDAYPAEPLAVSRLGEEYFEPLRRATVHELEYVRRHAGVDAEVLAIGDPSPARALQRAALDRAADLIVLGSSHRGAAGRLLVGDIGRGVLQHAPCPVAIAPRGFTGTREDLHEVLVGYDGSPEAGAALELARGWAQETGAAITILTAWDVPGLVSRAADKARDHATEIAEQAAADLPAGTETRVVRGAAPDVMLAAAEDADLVVVGSRQWGPVHRIAVGSTADHLVHHATCPVIVAPRPSTVPAEQPLSAAQATVDG